MGFTLNEQRVFKNMLKETQGLYAVLTPHTGACGTASLYALFVSLGILPEGILTVNELKIYIIERVCEIVLNNPNSDDQATMRFVEYALQSMRDDLNVSWKDNMPTSEVVTRWKEDVSAPYDWSFDSFFYMAGFVLGVDVIIYHPNHIHGPLASPTFFSAEIQASMPKAYMLSCRVEKKDSDMELSNPAGHWEALLSRDQFLCPELQRTIKKVFTEHEKACRQAKQPKSATGSQRQEPLKRKSRGASGVSGSVSGSCSGGAASNAFKLPKSNDWGKLSVQKDGDLSVQKDGDLSVQKNGDLSVQKNGDLSVQESGCTSMIEECSSNNTDLLVAHQIESDYRLALELSIQLHEEWRNTRPPYKA